MKKCLLVITILLYLTISGRAQFYQKLSPKLSLGTSTNLETYFFVEKLAVEHIGNYVFDIQGVDYSHQPIVYFGFSHFKKFKDTPLVIRAAEILAQIRDTFHDNGPILDYLLNQTDFPGRGARFPGAANKGSAQLISNAEVGSLMIELTDSLRKFYTDAGVGKFLQANAAFYKGAISETAEDVNPIVYGELEKWYGQHFPQYMLNISPAMPLTPGEGNYRGFGPNITSPSGKIPSMVISSSQMIPLKSDLKSYREFGFKNRKITSLLAKHEIIHSFVNPLLDRFKPQIEADSALFTPEFAGLTSKAYINSWYICLVEHLVRLGEIRTALAMNNTAAAEQLRQLHIGEDKCVLIPLLEAQILDYEKNRDKYPTFESYLPVLLSYIHTLNPGDIHNQVLKYAHYEADEHR